MNEDGEAREIAADRDADRIQELEATQAQLVEVCRLVLQVEYWEDYSCVYAAEAALKLVQGDK